MKPIFRAKEKHKNKWVYGFYYEQTDTHGKTIGYIRKDLGEDKFAKFTVDPMTLCQYVGIQDVNGNMVFENDICKYTVDSEESTGLIKNGRIQWIEGEKANTETPLYELKHPGCLQICRILVKEQEEPAFLKKGDIR